MNVQHSLIREFMLYEFKLGCNFIEVTKNISAKVKVTVDHCLVTRWFKKFCLVCKNLDDQAKSGRPKTVDSEAVLQPIEANLVSSTQRVSSELDISQSHVIHHHLHEFGKSIQSCRIFSLIVNYINLFCRYSF